MHVSLDMAEPLVAFEEMRVLAAAAPDSHAASVKDTGERSPSTPGSLDSVSVVYFGGPGVVPKSDLPRERFISGV